MLFPSAVGLSQRNSIQGELLKQLLLNQQTYHQLFKEQDQSSYSANHSDCSFLLTTLDSHLHYCIVSLQLIAFGVVFSSTWPEEVHQLYLLLQSLSISLESCLKQLPKSNLETQSVRKPSHENDNSPFSDLPAAKPRSSDRLSSYQPLLDVLQTSYLGILALKELGEELEENEDVIESHKNAILHAFEMVQSKREREIQSEDTQQHAEQSHEASSSEIVSREQPGVTYIYQAVAKKERLLPCMNDDWQEAVNLPENIQIRKNLVREMEMIQKQRTRKEQEQIVVVGEEMSVEEEGTQQTSCKREERRKMPSMPISILPFRELLIPREDDCEIFE